MSCGNDANSGGTVTSIATGAGLTGGPITDSGTISIAPGGIGATQINATHVQRRVTASCPVGQYLSAFNEDGTVACAVDAIGAPAWNFAGNAGTQSRRRLPEPTLVGTCPAQVTS